MAVTGARKGTSMTIIGGVDISGPEPVEISRPMTPEEQAAHDALVAGGQQAQATAAFAVTDDTERLAVIQERAATDPAYAALADFVLRGVRL